MNTRLEKAIEDSKAYTTQKELTDANYSLYDYIRKFGKVSKLCPHLAPQLTFWDKESCFKVALTYSTRTSLKKGNGTVYQWLLRNKLIDAACSHMTSKYTNWTVATATAKALSYEFAKDFRLANGGCYEWLRKNSLWDEIARRMARRDQTRKFKGLKQKSGLYFLYCDDVIVYIGKSEKGLAARLNRHTFDNSKVFDKVVVYTIDNLADIQLAELYLINIHSPIYNKDSNCGVPSTLSIGNLDAIITGTFAFTVEGASL